MTRYTIPSGTFVKHGTTSSCLQSILMTGIRPSFSRDGIRDKIEDPPQVEAVYVATLGAYIGSYRAFAASHYRLVTTGDGDPCFPVVLNVKLEEDCEVLADEDYVPLNLDGSIDRVSLQDGALAVWNKYESAALVRKNGIPADWIRSFEFPQLLQWEVVESGGRPAAKYWADVDLIVFSLAAPRLRNPILEWRELAKKWMTEDRIDFSKFSNREKFNQSGLDRFNRHTMVRDRNRFIKCCVSFEANVANEIRENGPQ